MILDAHQHYWRLSRGDYGWLTPDLGSIYRDVLPADMAPLRKAAGVERTIVVQAAPTEAETAFLLELAAADPSIAGVIGWTDFDAPNAADRIAFLAAQPLLVGLRPMIQDLPDDDWMLSSAVRSALQAMTTTGLVFDALVKPRHLARLLVLADRNPHLSIVIDHGAKPLIADGHLHPWMEDMAALAARPNTVVKLSGLATEAGARWSRDDLSPYVRHLISTFGPSRVLWGSDWPVLELAGDYAGWLSTCRSLTDVLPSLDREAIFGGNARRIYLDRRGRI